MTVLPQLKEDLRDAAQRTLPGEPAGARWRWASGGNLAASVSVSMALAIAALAIVLLGGRGQSNHAATGGSSLARIERTPYVRQLLRHFAVFRRPQTAADRSWGQSQRDTPSAGRFRTVELVPGLTRLGTTVDGDRIFLAVFRDDQPMRRAGRPEPFRYEMDVDLVTRRGGVSVAPWGPGVGDYLIVPVELPFALGYRGPEFAVSVVPDGVASVTWTYRCTRYFRCGGRRTETVRPHLRGNVATARIGRDAPVPAVTWSNVRGHVVVRYRQFTPGDRDPKPFPGVRP